MHEPEWMTVLNSLMNTQATDIKHANQMQGR